MLIAERRRLLLEQVHDRGYVSFRELADALDISESTVRRDLRSLVEEGLLTATRGGVGPVRRGQDAAGVAAPGPGDATGAPRPAADRHGAARPTPAERPADPVPHHREAIAAHAASLIVPGTAVLLGPGRTTTALARRLAGIEQLTVVTNSVAVTQALIDLPQIDVVLVGGALRRSIGAVVGPITEQALQGLRGAQVFLSGEGVTAERGLTTPNVFAAATDQALMAAGRQVVVLADHTKIGHDTMCQTVPSDRIDVLVTDDAADPDTLRRLRAEGVDVRIA
ncbi:DeoR/GlpR transcriptional regulator [Dactylosporangium aurantiacum]|uniref:DeoR/GlpR transcriptional regulator n=1 Tax=Dactylosporangium aurantiacum TaxID=35754 RepID=A0A9Q9IAC2_9ACTN|nr:DeoR/GlpR family DNA-binding transcription regulator [Dactylosporangium aurantiacum]MDG6110100.1 DeoR/GlpR family DNA-binding transcription regulator [Dactylosporangium aurantiacum]UWZ51351.1 DeoR/GlpR transcriptional regulator [Dactylosporangium aurantiacum]